MQVGPATWSQKPRLQRGLALQSWFLAQPRTKNQDGRARPPCNLGSTGPGTVQLVPICTGFVPVSMLSESHRPVQIGAMVQVAPATWNQQPRTKIAERSYPAILVPGSTKNSRPRSRTKNQDGRARPLCNLGSWLLVPICTGLCRSLCCRNTQAGTNRCNGTSCTGPSPVEPRTKNQDCRARPPCNLGSRFLVPRGRGRCNLYRFVAVCTGPYWCNVNNG